jgi:hypothetical protein
VDVPGRRLIYRDSAGALASFDLVAYRERRLAPSGTLAALGADGTLLAVDASGTVVESQPWGLRPWPGSVGRGVREVFVGPNARLVTLRREGGDSLQVVSREAGLAMASPVPRASGVAATREADAVALATDSGLVVLENPESEAPWFVPLAGRPAAVTFSPSGHRLYVALAEREELAVIDRFGRRARSPIGLPGPATELRADPWGRVLLAHGEGERVYVLSLSRERLLGEVSAAWSSDLPLVAADGTLLSREGRAVVARDARTLDSLGAVAGGAADLWFAGRWAPSRGTEAIRQEARAADTARGGRAAPPPVAGSRIFVQLSVSQNEAWARALAAELTKQGHPAAVASPAGPGDGWRVVMGPFATRDAADSAGRGAGRPYWIVERTPRSP